MNFIDQLDPELRVVVEKLPPDRPMNLNEISAARAKMKKMVTAMLAGLRFCESCGAKLPRPCPSCGHELKPQAKFCGSCGGIR